MRRGWLIALLLACAVAAPAPLRAEGHGEAAAGEDLDKLTEAQLNEKIHKALAEKKYKEAEEASAVLNKKFGPKEEHKPNLFGWSIDLAVWSAAVFLVMLLLLWKFAWGPMLQGLETREKNIHAAIEEAKAAREEAVRLQGQMQGEMAKAGEQARATIEEGRRIAAEQSERMLAEGKAAINAERERARRELDMAKDQGLQQMAAYAADLAKEVSAKVLRRDVNAEDHRRLVGEAIDDMKRAAQERQARFAGRPT
jgi:F-type H+-transporting ATPase subunit b